MRRSRRPAARERRIRRMVVRILAAWEAATAADLAAGRAWYGRAAGKASQLARLYGTTHAIAAGVIAALSPRCHWSLNVLWAGRILASVAAGDRQPPAVSTAHNRRAAWDIATGKRSPADALTGPKVSRFYRNIMGDTRVVTVDVWAALAAEGKRVPHAPTHARYADIETAYQVAADTVGQPARDVQAAAWVRVRGSAD